MAAIAVAVTAFVVTTWLLAIASHARPGTEQANAQLDAVRTGLTAGAGAGAAVGLMLAFRRQHHQEIATLLTDLDATERRVTELYTKAVEQLGNDKAPVRLGGLYALERLAQDHPAQRPTVVNVICAYLRMPFPSATPISKPAPTNTQNAVEPNTGTKAESVTADDTWQQERQVRLTAQQILREHLSKPVAFRQPADSSHSRFWPGVRLDLTGATITDFSLANRVVADAAFDGATFNGYAEFRRATFNGGAKFEGATFNGGAGFHEVTFNGYAEFDGATFDGDARFYQTTFNGGAHFGKVIFDGFASFERATVNGGDGYNGYAWFGDAIFNRQVSFYEATFNHSAGFDHVTFKEDAQFGGATISGIARFGGVTFDGAAGFGRTVFDGDQRFTNVSVRSSHDSHVWPAGWHLIEDGKGKLTLTPSDGNLSSRTGIL